MNFLKIEYCVEVKDKRQKIHPQKNVILRERKEPKNFRNSVSRYQRYKNRTESKKVIKKKMMNWRSNDLQKKTKLIGEPKTHRQHQNYYRKVP